MNVDESIIRKVLWEDFPDLQEWKINNIVDDMKKREEKEHECNNPRHTGTLSVREILEWLDRKCQEEECTNVRERGYIYCTDHLYGFSNKLPDDVLEYLKNRTCYFSMRERRIKEILDGTFTAVRAEYAQPKTKKRLKKK